MIKHKPNLLKPGQIVRYGSALYKVDFVNDCRARIVPLSKKQKDLADPVGLEKGGFSIGPTCVHLVVDDVERAMDEIELEEAEAEVRAAREELGARSVPEPLRSADAARKAGACAGAALGPAAPARAPVSGWCRSAKEPPAFKPGTLASIVMAYIVANPGRSTKEIVAGVAAAGAVAACVSRFYQAGLIERTGS